MTHQLILTCIVREHHLQCRCQCNGKVAIQLCNAKDQNHPSYFLPCSYKTLCNRAWDKYSDIQSRGTLLSTHFFSPSLAPIRSANVSRVSLMAAFGCFGNLCRSLASSPAAQYIRCSPLLQDLDQAYLRKLIPIDSLFKLIQKL